MFNYYSAIGVNPFDVLPLTFLVKRGLADDEFKTFCDHFYELGN